MRLNCGPRVIIFLHMVHRDSCVNVTSIISEFRLQIFQEFKTPMSQKDGTQDLFEAMQQKDLKAMKRALTKTIDIKKECKKLSLLSWCVKQDFLDGIDPLVEIAKVSFLRYYEYDSLAFLVVETSPLLDAVKKQNPEMVKKLLSHRNYFNQEMSQRLKKPFDILQFPWEYGTTVLHHAAELENSTMLRLLVEAQGDVNYIGGYQSFRYTFLVRAIRAGNLENVSYLVEQKTNLLLKDDCGLTAWNHAKSDVMKKLLSGEAVSLIREYKEYDPSLSLDQQLQINEDVGGTIMGGIFHLIMFHPILVKGNKWEISLKKSPMISQRSTVSYGLSFQLVCKELAVCVKDVSPADVEVEFQKCIQSTL